MRRAGIPGSILLPATFARGRARPGFTLVELLTVIAIIALLVGILIPSISAARNQARNASTAGLLKALGDAAEMFHGETRNYPASSGLNPFEKPAAGAALTGAQWLALQLVGPDQQGYVLPRIENDMNGDGKIDDADWHKWYDASDPNSSKVARLAPMVQPDGRSIKTPLQFEQEQLAADKPPDPLIYGGGTDWNNARLPMFIDSHGFPVLYYRANPFAPEPISTGTGKSLKLGVYDQSHNGYFTGYDGKHGEMVLSGAEQGWDLAGAGLIEGKVFHPMGLIGYKSGDTKWPTVVPSFASVVLDRGVFETTAKAGSGRLVPHNRERFLLIAAGRDGVYGTGDDVRNFE